MAEELETPVEKQEEPVQEVEQPHVETTATDPQGNPEEEQPHVETTATDPQGNPEEEQPHEETTATDPQGKPDKEQPHEETTATDPQGNPDEEQRTTVEQASLVTGTDSAETQEKQAKKEKTLGGEEKVAEKKKGGSFLGGVWSNTKGFIDKSMSPEMSKLRREMPEGQIWGLVDEFVRDIEKGNIEAGMYKLFFEMLFFPINATEFQIRAAKLRRKLHDKEQEKKDSDRLKMLGINETEAFQRIFNVFLRHGKNSLRIAEEIKKKNPEMLFKDFEKFKKNNPGIAEEIERLKKENPSELPGKINELMTSNPKDFLDPKNNKDMSILEDRILQSEFKKIYGRYMSKKELEGYKKLVGGIHKAYPNGLPGLQEQNNPQPRSTSRNDDRDDATAYGLTNSDSTLTNPEEQEVVQTGTPLRTAQKTEPTEPTRETGTLNRVASIQLSAEQIENLFRSIEYFKKEAAALNQQQGAVAENRQKLNKEKNGRTNTPPQRPRTENGQGR